MTEMSTVSTMSSASPAAPEAPKDGDDKFTKIGILVILVLLVLNGVVYFSRSSVPDQTAAPQEGGGGGGDDDGQSGGGGGGGGGIIIDPPAEPPAPTTPFVRRKTTAEDTTSPTPDQFVEPPSTPKVIPKKLETSVPDVLFCTVSYRALYESQMPPDGLCDFLAYTDVWVQATEVRSQYDQGSLEAFKRHAKAAQKTRHGASFSYRYAGDSEASMAKSSGSLIKPLWDSNVKDFGILLAYARMNTLRDVSIANLTLLKRLSTEQKKFAGIGITHIFLGIINRDFDRSSTNTLSMVKDVLTTYPITILILITHFFIYDWSSEPRPPGVWSSNVRMPADMSLIASKFSSLGIKPDVLFLTSYTMAVCKYRMPSGWGGGTQGNMESFAPVRYSETCFQKSSINTSPRDYVYIANRYERTLLMFDTAETIIYKLGAFYAQYAHPKHGVALYDVDYDDNTKECATETFHRVHEMKRYLHV